MSRISDALRLGSAAVLISITWIGPAQVTNQATSSRTSGEGVALSPSLPPNLPVFLPRGGRPAKSGARSSLAGFGSRFNSRTQSRAAKPDADASSIFLETSTYDSGGPDAFSIAAADVNGDGHPDLLVANECIGLGGCANGIGVLLGNGDGTFRPVVTYNSGGLGAISIAVADVNGDGHPDLLVANGCTDASCTSGGAGVLLGNGDGTFQPAATYSSGGQGAFSIAVTDVNGDGHPDLLIANRCVDRGCANGNIGVLLGNSNGTFQAAVTYSSGGEFAYSIAVGDVNGDGHPDLLVTNLCVSSNCTNGSIGVLLGKGNGTFQSPVTYSSGGREAVSIAVADVSGDGHPDLLVTNGCADDSCTSGSVGVLLGNGDGTFQPAISYGSGGQEADSIAVADVNGDGRPDLLVANQCAISSCADGRAAVLLGNGNGTFQPAVVYSSGGQVALAITVGDVNGDGHPDLLVANECAGATCADGKVAVLLGNGDGTFQSVPSYNSGGLVAGSIAVADVNGDGHPDLLVANECFDSSCTNGGVGVLLGNADGTFQSPLAYNSGNSGDLDTFSIAVADVNGDGHPDLLVANECFNGSCTHGGVGVLLGNGDGTFRAVVTYSSGGLEADSIAVADVNGDGHPDLLVANLYISGSQKATTTTTLASSANPSKFGQSVIFTATITASGGGSPTGTVTVFDGTNQIGSGTLAGTQAAFTTSSLSASSHAITAEYSGDANLLASTSPVLTQSVGKASTTTVLKSSVNPSSFDQGVTFTATVSPIPDDGGTVTLKDGAVTIGTGALSGGIAMLTTSSLAVKVHSLKATYAGDANFEGSTSGGFSQTVSKAATTTNLSSSSNPSSSGQSVTFTAKIAGQFGGMTTGTVTFKDGTSTLRAATLRGGIATFSTSSLKHGQHRITAAYGGDGNFKASTGSLVQTVH
jgi:hypothetical protein